MQQQQLGRDETPGHWLLFTESADSCYEAEADSAVSDPTWRLSWGERATFLSFSFPMLVSNAQVNSLIAQILKIAFALICGALVVSAFV